MATGLPEYFNTNRTLTCNDIGIVEGMYEHEVALARQGQRAIECAVVVVSMQLHFSAEVQDGLNFDLWGRLGHHDDGRYAAAIGCECHTLRVIAGGCTDCASLRDCVGEISDAVVRASQLEREDGLQVLPLQQDLVAQPARQAACFLQRRFDRDVIHARFEDSLYIRTGHGYDPGRGSRELNHFRTRSIVESRRGGLPEGAKVAPPSTGGGRALGGSRSAGDA